MKYAILLFLFLLLSVSIAFTEPPGIGGVQDSVVPFQGIVADSEYSPMGSYLAVAARQSRIRLYTSSMRTVWSHSGPHRYTKASTVLAFTHDERYMIFPGFQSAEDIVLLDLETFSVTDILYGHTDSVRALAVSGDSRYIVSTSSADDLVLWERGDTTYNRISATNDIHSRIGRIAFHAGEALFSCAHRDDTITVWRITNGGLNLLHHLKPEQHYGNTGYLYGMEFSPDGDYIVAGLRSEITIWKRNARSWDVHQVISDIPQGYIQSLEFSPDGKHFVCGFSRGVVRVFRQKGALFVPFDILDADQGYVEDVSIHPSGRRIAAAGDWDTALVLWKNDSLQPGPVLRIQEALGGRTTRAQKSVLTPARAAALVSAIDPFLFEPRDEFETEEEYVQRKNKLKSIALDKLQVYIEEEFAVSGEQNIEEEFAVSGEQKDATRGRISGTATVPLHHLDSYRLEEESYHITVLGTRGSIRIPRDAARSLKRSWQDAVVSMSVRPAPDGISRLYTDFTLIHPKNGNHYPVSLQENPFHAPPSPEKEVQFKEVKAGPLLVVQDIVLQPIFPVLYRFYTTSPIGKVTLFNTGSAPAEDVRVLLSMDRYMDSRGIAGAESGSIDIPAGQKADAELYALFNDTVLSITEGDTVSALLTVIYTVGGEVYETSVPRVVRFLGRNAVTWDDDKKVAGFMTAKDPEVLKFSKQSAALPGNAGFPALDENLITALKLFESLRAVPVVYTIDPSSPYVELSKQTGTVDFIQFPGQTLDFKAGDCDDLSILFNTLLESLGVPTAFITIPGHIFTAFQLKTTPRETERIFAGEPDYIVSNGRVWVPVETTLTTSGFLNAWTAGIRQWKKYNSEGNAELFTVHSSWKRYEPVNFQLNRDLSFPDKQPIADRVINEIAQFTSREVREHEQELAGRYAQDRDNPGYLNKLGLVYSRFGMYDKALVQFEKSAEEKDYIPGIMNAGNVHLSRGDVGKAVQYYLRAAEHAPDNPRILLTLGRAYRKQGEEKKAEETLGRARQIDPDISLSFPEVYETGEGRASQAEAVPFELLSEEWE